MTYRQMLMECRRLYSQATASDGTTWDDDTFGPQTRQWTEYQNAVKEALRHERTHQISLDEYRDVLNDMYIGGAQ